jgi:hypothetical protein
MDKHFDPTGSTLLIEMFVHIVQNWSGLYGQTFRSYRVNAFDLNQPLNDDWNIQYNSITGGRISTNTTRKRQFKFTSHLSKCTADCYGGMWRCHVDRYKLTQRTACIFRVEERAKRASSKYLVSLSIIRACRTNGEKRNAHKLLVGTPEGKRQLARPRRRWWMTLSWILERHDETVLIGLDWLRIRTSGEIFWVW